VKNQTITLLVIISLISSILSTALTSDQVYPSYGKESDNGKTKTKETKVKTKSESKPKSEGKPKSDSKPKEDTGSSNDNSKSNGDTNSKGDDTPSTTDTPSKTNDQTVVSKDVSRCPNGTHRSPSGDCEKPIDHKGMPRCPNGTHRSPSGVCEPVCETPSNPTCKPQPPQPPQPPCDTTTDPTCKPQPPQPPQPPCDTTTDPSCKPQPPCDTTKETCPTGPDCTKTPLPPGCPTQPPTKESSKIDIVIKYYITNPIIQKQITQQPSSTLTQLDTIQFCNLIKDQACVFTNSNFKILFSQMTKDSFGNWVLNGEAQNIAFNPINNVRVILHLYDSQGNIVGLTQGLPTPSNLGIGQTTLFNLQENPTSLTGTPTFYRVSFDFLS
jgi:hypothetical protein